LYISFAVHVAYSWWANVAYWIALASFCAGKWSRAWKWALAATALAGAWTVQDPRSAMHSPAFLLWAGSMAVLTVGALVLALVRMVQNVGSPGRDS
jgi:hypothetical protein